MLRYLQWASFTAFAISLWPNSLLHFIIEAGLAREILSVVVDVKCNRTAEVALEVSELVSM